jgi:hypothetical protein
VIQFVFKVSLYKLTKQPQHRFSQPEGANHVAKHVTKSDVRDGVSRFPGILWAGSMPVVAQTATLQHQLITQRVDEQKLVTLYGSTRLPTP